MINDQNKNQLLLNQSVEIGNLSRFLSTATQSSYSNPQVRVQNRTRLPMETPHPHPMDSLQLLPSGDPCRLCLKKCEQSYGLYVNSPDGMVRELARKILDCIALEITDNEPEVFSKLVCSDCIYKLDYFHEFRENCRKCQAFFSGR